MSIPAEDLQALARAVKLLENPGFTARLANLVGVPVEQVLKRLPPAAGEAIQRGVTGALQRCLKIALRGMRKSSRWSRSERAMKTAVALTGAAGGAFGFAALAIELPVTTTIMLRSIAEIARKEGEDVHSPAGALACLEVFALGSGGTADSDSEIGYFGIRAGLAQEVNAALRHFAQRAASRNTAPSLIRLIESIAARFGIVVSEKVAAGAIPVLGALGSATVNTLFMKHFQDMAHGHFIVRRLERKYGEANVRAEYGRLASRPQ